MKRKFIPVTLALLLTAAGFSGCTKRIANTDMAGTSKEKPAATKTAPSVKSAPEATVSSTETPETSANVAPMKNMIIEDVYFDFDRYSIRADSRKALEDDAAILKDNAGMKITIEGHCDERGPAEYNLVLGQKRADAVKRYLNDLGVEATRIATISYGNEKPFCTEHNEACWQKNRRAHFVKK